jgi:hypothetical protein
LENLTLSKSFPDILIKKLNGVSITKYTRAITMGAIILPNISPNLIHDLFKGVKILAFIIPRIKNAKAIGKNSILGLSPLIKGHNPIKRKTMKNKKLKPLLFSLDFIKYFLN